MTIRAEKLMRSFTVMTALSAARFAPPLVKDGNRTRFALSVTSRALFEV